MAAPVDPLSTLSRLARLERLDSLLSSGTTTPAGGMATATTPVTPVEAIAAGDAIHPEQPSVADTHPGTPSRSGNAATLAQGGAPGAASSQTRLSADATLIALLLEEAPGGENARLPVAAVDAAHESPAQLAQSLARSLATNGLFYESHLQEWVVGERALASLRAEPHNRLPTDAPQMNTRAGPAAGSVGDAPDGGSTSRHGAPAGDAARSATPLPAALATIVREQLDTLDLQRVHWHGEVWAQQTAQLEIAAEAGAHEGAAHTGGDGRDGEDTHGGRWHSNLRITLPELGLVEVRIDLVDGTTDVRVHGEARALTALQAGSAGFAQALVQAGVTLRRLEIASHG